MKIRVPLLTRSTAVVATAVLAAGLVACGPNNEPAQVDSTVTVTDIAGRSVAVKSDVQRVFLGEGRLLYLTAMLDKQDPLKRIVGWPDDLKTADLDTYDKYRENFPQIDQVPVVGALAKGSFSAEKVIDLKPDVVVLTKSGFKSAQEIGAVDTLAKVGIPTVVVDFRDKPLETTVPSVKLLGTLMNRQEQANTFADYYAEQIDLVRTRVAGTAQPTTFLYRAAGITACCATFGPSNLGQVIELAGGRNLGSQLLPGESGSVAEEQLFASNPDQIVITGSNWTRSATKVPGVGFINLGYKADEAAARAQLDALVARPGWDNLKAVKDSGAHGLWHQFYGSPYNFVAAIQIAKWQHPDKFTDVDPTAVFREFHEKFLPITYSGTFWVSR